MVTADDIPVAHTPEGGWHGEMPAPILAGCTEPLTPFERKELMRLLLKRAEVGDRQIVLEIYPVTTAPQGESRSEAPNWLPGLVPQSVLRDVFTARLPSLARRLRRVARDRARMGRQARAAKWRSHLDSGEVASRSDLAKRMGVSRARVTYVLGSAS
jgi:hypothetical protein